MLGIKREHRSNCHLGDHFDTWGSDNYSLRDMAPHDPAPRWRADGTILPSVGQSPS